MVTLHPIGPTAYDKLMSEHIETKRRLTRMETRLCKMMVHFGLDELGLVPHPNPHHKKEQQQS
jgi:hypothetical protein